MSKYRKLMGIVALVVTLAMWGAVAQAQQPARIPRIGILITGGSLSFNSARVEAFRQRLREHGYVEGKNIVIEYRYAEGKRERLPDLAAELVRLKVDVIVTTGAVPVLAAKKASPTIPIVFASSSDPVGSGLVSSLAQPGGTITGLSQMAPDLDGKRLELLKEAFPKIVRVAFLWQAGGVRGTWNSQTWRLRPRCWESNFNRFRCEALTILRAHSCERKGNVPRPSLRAQVDLSLLRYAKCWTSR
jgi:putative tryptophan/tyrosine transport system substrate-binding protein